MVVTFAVNCLFDHDLVDSFFCMHNLSAKPELISETASLKFKLCHIHTHNSQLCMADNPSKNINVMMNIGFDEICRERNAEAIRAAKTSEVFYSFYRRIIFRKNICNQFGDCFRIEMFLVCD